MTVEMIPMKKLEVDIRLKLCNQRKDKLLKCNSLLVEMVELVNSWIKRETRFDSAWRECRRLACFCRDFC